MQDLRQQTVRGVAWSAVQNWGSRVISFLVFPILAHKLSPEAFGLVALAGVYIALLEVFADESYGTAIEQRASLEAPHLDSTFWFFLGSGLILATLSIALAKPIAAFFKNDELAPILRWLSLSYVLTCLSGVQTSLLRRDLRMRALALRSLLATAAGGLVGIGMAFGGWGVWSLVGQQLAAGAVGVVVLWASSPWRPQWRFSWPHFRQVGSIGLPVMGARVLDFFNRRFDSLLIGRFLGAAALGYYNVAYRLLLLLTQLLTGSATQVAMPAFAKVQSEPARVRGAYYGAVRLTSLVAFPVFFAVLVLAPEIVRLIFGPGWGESEPVVRILALVGVLHSVQYYNASVMVAMGRARQRLGLLAVHATVNTVGFLLAVRHGITAVAAVYAVRGYLLAPMDLYYVRRLIDLEYLELLRQLAPALTCSTAMAAALLVARHALPPSAPPLIVLPVAVVVGGLVYLGLLGVAWRSTLRELLGTLKMLRKS